MSASSSQVTIIAEVVQVVMRRSVCGFGHRGDLVHCGLDTAAGLMEAGLAYYVDVIGFTAELEDFPEGEPGGKTEGKAGARGRKGDRAGRGTA